MDRIEVERKIVEQRRSQKRDGECSDDDGDTMRLQKAVNGRQHAVSDLFDSPSGLSSVISAGKSVMLVA